MLRRSYDRLMRLAAGPSAPLWLSVVAFCEGVFFPIPPDVMLMPMVLARREHAWRYAALCTVSSALGGSVGYAIGYFLHPVGHWLLSLTGHGDSLDAFQAFYAHWGVVLLAVPVPYKLLAIASGLARFNFLLFVAASVVVRGLRFFIGAALVKRYGEPIRAFVERRLALVTGAVAVAVVGVVVALKFV